ncbi:MAG: response regulator [Magnetospirillum sp. WYHS-4]
MNGLEDRILKAKILVVDDNPVNVALLCAILENAGYVRVDATSDPRKVEGLFRERHHDLILLDIRMPYLDGIQVMEILKRDLGDDYLPVLVLTAQTDQETRRRALDMGAKDFLTKPFEQWEVLLRIRNMLEARIYYSNQRLRAEELEAVVRERTQEVRQTQLEIVRRLGRAGEFRDNETGAHVIRMSRASQMLALAAGWTEAQAETILYASPMHDVGKIGIPDAVLLKPGRLDPEERRIMERHVTIGADILEGHDSELMRMARSIALTHHEKWDGSGYPNGLKGEDIPFEGRIGAVCDVFDALTSARPYKQPWPLEQAVLFLKENAGIHFDPLLVDLFERIAEDVFRLREQFPDGE